jgi:hypothetical protein
MYEINIDDEVEMKVCHNLVSHNAGGNLE